MEDTAPRTLELFFQVADGTEVVGKLSIGNRLLPKFNRPYFQHNIVAMWIDRLLRTCTDRKIGASVMRACPISSIEPYWVVDIKRVAGDQPLAVDAFERRGWSNLAALEITAVRTMFMDFDAIQPSERFTCRHMVDLRPNFSIRFQAALKGSVPFAKQCWLLVCKASEAALDATGANEAIKSATAQLVVLKSVTTFAQCWTDESWTVLKVAELYGS